MNEPTQVEAMAVLLHDEIGGCCVEGLSACVFGGDPTRDEARRVIASDAFRALVAEAVDRERAAWATKIEQVCGWGVGRDTGGVDRLVPASELRALLAAGDWAKGCGGTFVGNVEGRDIMSDDVDVVVTDGFTGNIVLKTTEGAASALTGLIRNAIEKAGVGEKLGALLLQGTFAGLKKVTDYAEIGGAPLLGLNGVGIVAHGRSSAKAVKNALRAAMEQVEAGLFEELSRRIASASAWLPAKETLRQKGGTSDGV